MLADAGQPLLPAQSGKPPNGRKMRSLSVSDIIVTHEGCEAHAYYVEPIGYKQVDDLLPGLEQAKKRSVAREER